MFAASRISLALQQTNTRMKDRIKSFRAVTLLILAAGCVFPASVSLAQSAMMQKPALEGFCAVCVVEMKSWDRGRPEFASTYDGMTYQFPSAAIKGKFDSMPPKYVPALGGDCVVCYAKMGKRVPGDVRFSALHERRLFLFPSDAEKKMFLDDPRAFENVDLAAGGDCAVCLAKMGKHVPGNSQFTEVYQGFRYQFPSAAEQAEFRRSPAEYADATTKMGDDKMMNKTGIKSMDDGTNLVSIAGRGGCAACEHGIHPLTSPGELGLAINTSDGKIVVVEEAHKLYPEVYASRFKGPKIEVEGSIVKTAGKVSWLQPSKLRVVN